MNPSSENPAEHLFHLERQLQDPAFRSDPEKVGNLLVEGFREFGASGRVFTRLETIAALASETPYVITSRDFACTMLSPSAALVTYISRDGKRETRRSSLWQLGESGWQILFHQGTAIPPSVS